MAEVLSAAGARFEVSVPVVIIGAGACGLTAALAARQTNPGQPVLVLERDATPAGSTALSSGFIPACGTRWQRAVNVADSVAGMAADIQRKANNEADPELVDTVCWASGPTLEWLANAHGLDFELIDEFLYPGHSVARMHALPERTGSALIAALLGAAQQSGVDVLTRARVTALYADNERRVHGVRFTRPDGSTETVGCDALILACNGFGGNPSMVVRYIPEMAGADYFGHTGNQGEAMLWGEALGGELKHMGAYQGHGSVAVPQQLLITWALMMQGGIQVNAAGERFSNEHAGYSEQSLAVLGQPGGVAWNIFDQRLHELGLGFDDYRRAWDLGAIRRADTVAELAERLRLPPAALAASIVETQAAGIDRFGRNLGKTPPLNVTPFYGVKVTGALFHTQGGLWVDGQARVLDKHSGLPLPNLYAGGGAAAGVSGSGVAGYLSGNGLLTAVTLGRIAGNAAALE